MQMAAEIYPATGQAIADANISSLPKGDDKVAELVHDFVVEKLGSNNFSVTARIITRDGREFQHTFTNPGQKQRAMIFQVVALQHVARRMNSDDPLFELGFSSGAQWKIVKHEGLDGKVGHRYFLHDPREPDETQAWRPVALVNKWSNLWNTESEYLYLAKFDDKHTSFAFDSKAMVEGAPAFQGTGVKGAIGSIVGPMIGNLPGGAGKGIADRFGLEVTTYDKYVDQASKVASKMRDHLDWQRRLWDEIDDQTGLSEQRQRLHMEERLRQLSQSGSATPEQEAEIKLLTAQVADNQ
jgi:hypothetical protein